MHIHMSNGQTCHPRKYMIYTGNTCHPREIHVLHGKYMPSTGNKCHPREIHAIHGKYMPSTGNTCLPREKIVLIQGRRCYMEASKNKMLIQEQNIGMNWSYSLERLPSSHRTNNHIVNVLSYPRDPNNNINVR